jgi:hypothetical protein
MAAADAVSAALTDLEYAEKFPGSTVGVAAAKTLRRIVGEEVVAAHDGSTDLPLVTSLMLAPDKGVLAFLERSTAAASTSAASAPLTKAREECVLLVKDLIKLLGPARTERHAQAIRATLFATFRRDSANLVRVACLTALEHLLALRVASLADGESARAQDMAEVLAREYAAGKSSQSVKAGCLRVLGVLSELYPEHMRDRTPQLINGCLETLAK